MTLVDKSFEEMLAEEGSIDLGNDAFYKKALDRDDNWIAITHWHKNSEGKLCGGWVPFNVESEYILPGTPKWEVESREPLTMSPSLLCGCGNHGFIRNGRWEPC